MLRSMYSAISGLKGNQVYMDVIGNNIANVNTTAYKSGAATFATTLSQALRPASAATGQRGGINPLQVGLGMTLQSINTDFTQGDMESTGRDTDMGIDGNGFFILSDGTARVYSRDGAFDLGTDGSLLNSSTGYKVMGWMSNAAGKIDTTQGLQSLIIPTNSQASATPTSKAVFAGNLDSSTAVAGTLTTNMEFYDASGGQHTVSVTFTKGAANSWNWALSAPATDTTIASVTGSGTITFSTVAGSVGKVATGGTGTMNVTYTAASGIPASPNIALDFTTMTQYNQTGEVNMTEQNGCEPGTFLSFSVDQTGIITALYSNGARSDVGQIALARFTNVGGLLSTGGNAYTTSPNSGNPVIAAPNSAGLGTVNSCYLESGNVDLAQQFTDMIVASRGFQANSRVITTADEMLQELVNLKR